MGMDCTINISVLPAYGDKERFINALSQGFKLKEDSYASSLDIDDSNTEISDDKSEVVALVRNGVDDDTIKALSIHLDTPVFTDEYSVDDKIYCSAVMAHQGRVERVDFAEELPQKENGDIDDDKMGEVIDATSEKAGNALNEFKSRFKLDS